MITINNSTISYKGKRVINDLSLSVGKGEIYGLLGSNGAGKSTTLNMLLGFIKPESGASYINGINTTTQAQKARQQIGYIPENVALYPYLTGIENLNYFCRLASIRYNSKELIHVKFHHVVDVLSLNQCSNLVKYFQTLEDLF